MARRVATGETPEDSLRLLADAGALLASTLDYDRILENLAHLAVPRFASWCIVDMVADDGEIERAVVVSNDAGAGDHAERLAAVRGLDLREDRGIARVIRDGEPLFMPAVDEADLEGAIGEPVTHTVLAELHVTSLLIVPIASKGRICGAITFALTDPGQRYSGSDLLLAEDLGRRAGLAIDNARHYMAAQRTAEELRMANEAKDEFLGLISHELRTPITVIHGGARILRLRGDRLDDERRRALISDIEEEADRLHRIVENLLALSRAQLKDDYDPEPVLMQRVISQISDTYRRRQRRRTVEITAPDGFPPVAGDQGYVEQILRNLISNADKYSPPEAIIEITLAETAPGVATVEVLDHGQGVPEQDMERIFDRFYRSHANSATAGGAGMGLAVCRRLVEAMSGTISAVPREGGGLVLAFTLPLYER